MKIMQYPQSKSNVIPRPKPKLNMTHQIVLSGIPIGCQFMSPVKFRHDSSKLNIKSKNRCELISVIQIKWRSLKLNTIYQMTSRFYKSYLNWMVMAKIEYRQSQSCVTLRRPLNLDEFYIFNRNTKQCDSRVEIPPREWLFYDILGLF